MKKKFLTSKSKRTGDQLKDLTLKDKNFMIKQERKKKKRKRKLMIQNSIANRNTKKKRKCNKKRRKLRTMKTEKSMKNMKIKKRNLKDK